MAGGNESDSPMELIAALIDVSVVTGDGNNRTRMQRLPITNKGSEDDNPLAKSGLSLVK
jgi:hypothetical protein